MAKYCAVQVYCDEDKYGVEDWTKMSGPRDTFEEAARLALNWTEYVWNTTKIRVIWKAQEVEA